MRVIPFRVEHAAGWAPARGITPENLARMEACEGAITVAVDGKVLMCAGGYEIWKGRIMMWAMVDHDAARGHWLTVHKAARALVKRTRDNARRVEAYVACGFEAGRRWVEHLGFRAETTRMGKFMPDGGDATMYVIVGGARG